MKFTPQSYAERARAQRIPVASEATWTYLQEQLKIYRPRCVLEIGAAVGSTSCRIGNEIQERGGKLYSCEISYPTYHLARWWRNTMRCRNVHLIHADILQVALREWLPEPVDFVFIDGMKMQYADYLQLIRPYCRVGACIIFDDVRAYADKMDTLRDLLKRENIIYTITDLADGDGVIKLTL